MRKSSLVGLVLWGVCGCGGGDGPHGKIRITPNVIAGREAMTGQALRIGSPTAATLRSLKYYIRSIQLCQDIEIQGTAFGNAKGCISLYDTPDDHGDYDHYTVNEAKDDNSSGHYIDLMTAAGQATLHQTVTLDTPLFDGSTDAGPGNNEPPPSAAGVYRYGTIGFYRPIKATAEFPVFGHPDQYFRTRAVQNVITGLSADGRNNIQTVQIGNTLAGPTEETTYMLNNGGMVFTFQKPFVVTQADVDAKAEVKMDLVFNPDNFGQAYEMSEPCATNTNVSICDPTNNVVIDMPYVRMNPVPRKTGERTRKEAYLMDYTPGAKLRIELYYNDADPEAGVQGVDSAVVYDDTATQMSNNVIASNYVSQTGSVNANNATVTLMDYQRTPNLELVRRQSGTATVHCLFAGSLCPTVGGTASLPYTYVGDTIVSSD